MPSQAPNDDKPEQMRPPPGIANGPSLSEQGPVPAAKTTIPLPSELKLPSQKDASLKEFLTKLDDYAPIIPDAVTHYYMTRAGLPPPPQTDARLVRLLALATQKFVADVAADAYQYSRMRGTNSNVTTSFSNLGGAAGLAAPGQQAGQPAGQPAGGKDAGRGAANQPALGVQRPGFGGGGQGGSQNRVVLTMEDLGMAVGEYGVNVKRSEFYR